MYPYKHVRERIDHSAERMQYPEFSKSAKVCNENLAREKNAEIFASIQSHPMFDVAARLINYIGNYKFQRYSD